MTNDPVRPPDDPPGLVELDGLPPTPLCVYLCLGSDVVTDLGFAAGAYRLPEPDDLVTLAAGRFAGVKAIPQGRKPQQVVARVGGHLVLLPVYYLAANG